jgi:hypothetical protein
MPYRRLPPELISLVHHIELNKSGWWDVAVQQIILATIWLCGNEVESSRLDEKVQQEFSASIEPARLRRAAQSLCASGVLVELLAGRLRISQDSLEGFESGLAEAQLTERRVRSRFESIFKECCPRLDAAASWAMFNDHFLIPFIRDMGAATYGILSGTTPQLDTSDQLTAFLARFPDDSRESVRRAVVTFLDPKAPDVRRYVVACLNTCLILEASNPTAETLRALMKMAGRAPTFRVLVDTNFVFSILGLHDNPSNEAANSLMGVTARLAAGVTLRFYISPLTLNEARSVLAWHRDSLDLYLTPNLAQAASESELRGLPLTYAQEVSRVGRPISAADYFGPYAAGLLQVLRSKGVELYNEPLERYKKDQRVIDDILEQLDREKSRPSGRGKDYPQLEHDIALWYAVRDKRPKVVESPLDAGYWIVTVDYGFLGFDRSKRTQSEEGIPVCLHPTTLIQMLQFWVPRTPVFEEAVLSTLRMPLLFQAFDVRAERAAIRILGILSRFENADDLPVSTVSALLTSQALLDRLTNERDVERQTELVREALIDENRRARESLTAASTSFEALRAERDDAVQEKTRLGEELARTKDLHTASQDELAAMRQKVDALECREHERTKSEEADRRRRQAMRERTRFIVCSVVCPAGLAAGAAIAGAGPLSALLRFTYWQSSLLVWGLLVCILLWWIDRAGSRLSSVGEWTAFRAFRRFRTWLQTAGGLAVLGSIGSGLWDLYSPLLRLR